MISFIRSAWRSGLRGRSFQVVFLLGLALVAAAYLASMFSPRQPQTVALDVGLSGMRFTLILLALFWVQELVGREIERRTVVLTLAYPMPRSRYLIGRFLGIGLLLAIATLVLALLLWAMVLWSGGGYEQARKVSLGSAYWVTIGGLFLGVVVVLAFAMCLSTLSTVLVLPFALGIGFAIIGNSLGAVMDFLLTRQADGDQAMAARFGPIIDIVSWTVPDLSRLDWRDWTLYGTTPDFTAILWAIAMGLGYATLMLAIGVLAFRRREFG